jgi:hypothetical protein
MVIKWGPLERVRFTTQAIIVPIEHPRFPDFGPYRIRMPHVQSAQVSARLPAQILILHWPE